jgi:two-component sensor histidine kinase
LGLKIVSMLAEDQLHGQILIDREAGTRFRIIFPLEREG